MLPGLWHPAVLQTDCMIGFTSAANALLATVLQSSVTPPPPLLFLLQVEKINRVAKPVMIRINFFILFYLRDMPARGKFININEKYKIRLPYLSLRGN